MPQIINALAERLYGKIPDEDLKLVVKEATMILANYDVKEKEHSVIPYVGCIPQAYKDYMVTKKIEGKSEKSLALYKLYLEHMFNTVQTPIRDITANMMKSYLYRVSEERQISNRSLNSRRSILHSFFSWAAAEGYIDKDPMATIKPIKYEEKKQKPLTDIELEKCRINCKDIREKALLEFLYSTGCRVTELERMNISDVDFNACEATLFGKGNKHRTSYLSAKAAIYLKQYLDTRADKSEALFVYEKAPYNRLKKAGIEKIVADIGKRSGIDHLHPHQIRHTTATNMLQHGADVTQVKELLGHKNINTTMIYAEISTADVKRSHQKYII